MTSGFFGGKVPPSSAGWHPEDVMPQADLKAENQKLWESSSGWLMECQAPERRTVHPRRSRGPKN